MSTRPTPMQTLQTEISPTSHRTRCGQLWACEPPMLDTGSFQCGPEYKWKRLRSSQIPKAGAFATTDMAVFDKVLPPDAADFMDSEACEDFNEYITVTGLNKFYITLPPKLRGDHLCRDPTPSTSRILPTACNLAVQALEQVRLTRVKGHLFTLGCAAHGTFEAYASERARFLQDFHSFRAWKLDGRSADAFISTLMSRTSMVDSPAPHKSFMALEPTAGDVLWESPQSVHERYREELFGATRHVPRKQSVQFSDRYRWQYTWGSHAPAGLYKIGAMQAQMLLPPDPEDYMDPQACEAFNRYLESDRPERLYALIPPMSSTLRCAVVQDITGLIPGNLTRQGCTTEMPAWSQTELSFIDGTEYCARCLHHRPLEDHELEIAQQRDDFHQFRKTEAMAEMRSVQDE